MRDEPSSVSARTVDARVLRTLRNRRSVPGGAAGGSLAARLRLPEVRRRSPYPVRSWRAAVLAVRRMPAPSQPDQRHDVRGQQAVVDALVPGHAVADPVQEQRLGAGVDAPARRVLPQRLAAQAQDHGGDAVARAAARARRTRGDRRRLPRWRAQGGKAGRGSENKMPFVAAVQITATGHPVFACLAAAAHHRTARRVHRTTHGAVDQSGHDGL